MRSAVARGANEGAIECKAPEDIQASERFQHFNRPWAFDSGGPTVKKTRAGSRSGGRPLHSKTKVRPLGTSGDPQTAEIALLALGNNQVKQIEKETFGKAITASFRFAFHRPVSTALELTAQHV